MRAIIAYMAFGKTLQDQSSAPDCEDRNGGRGDRNGHLAIMAIIMFFHLDAAKFREMRPDVQYEKIAM
eukprot:3965013-Heterocapsa_arctica.AAC.1